ncbi:fumarylacetoacetate hydrolase family protein [Paenibacillus aceris]|uniref:2-keto-4-pentenoate hydratase/2-oxohepta-3-ene-1,7-dioic acid hydratase in catechol pathway n=1 Tax=Paenibacillus aceris TaxID=869555 RepID=A0ABS4I6T1_9BACL|nr:fumarylacetoacetate hydrolase family protein [Paenibacillus aceris]MBP1966618.1 2-keto-4-pentenoate hydratase/2-oxohepta-3-ene-1,7-dioic acid hydratase in catechol pathway [Paenibacillus aceris]NHW38854.1 fumarylacetoacetate hydrolase family protein [Paenibacillus aceris]
MYSYFKQTRKIIGVGPNFKAFREQKGITHEEDPFLFIKSPQSLTAETDIYLPGLLSEFICEVEMAVIIGQEARNIAEEDVPSIVAGFAIANDITASAHFDTGRFKLFDQMTPIGDMVSDVDPYNVDLEMWVNGKLVQKDNTANLLFSANWLISHISRMATLCKGDIILTGTPANPLSCQIGDVIEMKSPQLGNHQFTIHREL